MIRHAATPLSIIALIASCSSFGEDTGDNSASSSGSTSSSSSSSGGKTNDGDASANADSRPLENDGSPDPTSTRIEDDFNDGDFTGWVFAGDAPALMGGGVPSAHLRFATVDGIPSLLVRTFPRSVGHDHFHVELDVRFVNPLPLAQESIPIAAIEMGGELFGIGTTQNVFLCLAGAVGETGGGSVVTDNAYHRFKFDVIQATTHTEVTCGVDDGAKAQATSPKATVVLPAKLQIGSMTEVATRVDIDNVAAFSDKQ